MDLCYGLSVVLPPLHPDLSRKTGTTVSVSDSANARRRPMPCGHGFEIETLMRIRIANASLAVVEVPRFEHPRLHDRTNLDAFGDGLRVTRTIAGEFGTFVV